MIIIQFDFKQGFIDCFLLMMEFYEIFVIIVFNKVDFYDVGYVGVFEYLWDIYEYIGYKVILVFVLEGQGIFELKVLLKDKIIFIIGQLGVGKLMFVNVVEFDLEFCI